MKVAFIGLGIMGSRMAANLLTAGHSLTVHNRSKNKAADLLAAGAQWAATPAAAARDAEVVVTMLAHPQAVTSVVQGDDGMLAGIAAGAIWMDCSTVNPAFSREMAALATAQGVRFLDAPVGGSKNQAQQAQLVFLVGGDAADVATCQPLFDAMGSRVAHIGGHGMGTSLKLVINYLLAASMAAFAEAMALGEGLGLSQDALFNALIGSVVVPPYMAGKQAKMASGDYAPEFPLQWMRKDVQLASDTAYEVGVAMPVANVVKEVYQLAVQQGWGEQDFSALYRFMQPARDGTA